MRTLPLRLAPAEGESLPPGYVARYSHTYQFPPGDVIIALGLNHDGQVTSAGRYGVWLAPGQREHVALATGIAVEVLGRMLLGRYAGRAFERTTPTTDVLAEAAQAHDVMIRSSKFCPHCLGDHGAWRLRWQLGWSAICPRHGVLLARACPACGTVPKAVLRSWWVGDRQGPLSDPTCCARRVGGELCRTHLAAIETPTVDEEAVGAQRRIDTLLDGGPCPAFAGEQLQPAVYLRCLHTLCKLLAYHAQLRSQADQPPPRSGRRLFEDPATVTAVLPDALGLADLPDRPALADAAREIVEDRYHQDSSTLRLSQLGDVPVTLRDTLRHALSEAVWSPPLTRIGLHPRAHRRPTDLDPRLQARHVPQLLWAEDYELRIAGLFDFDDFTHWHGRRICSRLLDYKHRRALLADWAGFDRDTWQLLKSRPGQNRWRADTPSRRARASVWLWCELTCGHERAGPVALPTSNLAHQGESIRDALPDLRERLVIFGRLLLATPADSREMLPARFEALLGERGDVIFRPDSTGRRLEPHERRERPIPPRVPPAVADRVLAHVAAHTGVDIPTLTTISFPGMQAPPAVIHARLLAAALLQRTWPTSWNAIGEAINQDGNRLADWQHAYRTACQRQSWLADELDRLGHAVDSSPAPIAPTTPHGQRMRDVAEQIQARAIELLAASHGTHIARRASIAACRQHTDLTCPVIAAIHDIADAQPAFSRATVARYRPQARGHFGAAARAGPSRGACRSRSVRRGGHDPQVMSGDRLTRSGAEDLNVPRALRPDVEQIIALTDGFCAEHLDAEYARLCARLVAKLARKRPSPLLRGELRIWAAATIYTIGSVNFLFDRAQPLHLTGDDLSDLTGVPKSTMANKAKQIRDLLGLGRLDLEFCRRDMIESHPSAWYVQVDGLIVDARMLPAALQDECRRRGLIPDLAAGA